MRFNYKSEIKVWSVYFITIVAAVFFHELGHCAVAWVHGVKAIPTPAKTYLPERIPAQFINAFSLGGIMGTFVFSALIILLFIFSKLNVNSTVLAGALANPGMYAFLFFLKGRGHGGTEFQKAQAALGQSYSGHFLDWFLIILFVIGVVVWIILSKPSFKLIPRVIIGIVISILFLTLLQDVNNKIFDPIFQ